MPYHIVYDEHFKHDVQRFPRSVREKLEYALDLLADNPHHSTLHTKPLSGSLKGNSSFRIGRDIRVIFIFKDTTTIQLLKIANRDKAYRQ